MLTGHFPRISFIFARCCQKTPLSFPAYRARARLGLEQFSEIFGASFERPKWIQKGPSSQVLTVPSVPVKFSVRDRFFSRDPGRPTQQRKERKHVQSWVLWRLRGGACWLSSFFLENVKGSAFVDIEFVYFNRWWWWRLWMNPPVGIIVTGPKRPKWRLCFRLDRRSATAKESLADSSGFQTKQKPGKTYCITFSCVRGVVKHCLFFDILVIHAFLCSCFCKWCWTPAEEDLAPKYQRDFFLTVIDPLEPHESWMISELDAMNNANFSPGSPTCETTFGHIESHSLKEHGSSRDTVTHSQYLSILSFEAFQTNSFNLKF